MLLVIAIVLGVVALAHTAPFPFLIEGFKPKQSVWRVPSPRGVTPAIYLTFDDGPNRYWTAPVLDALRDTGATATFFLIDEHITPDTEPLVRRMVDEGHAIGLHSGSRRPVIMAPEELAKQLRAAAARITAIGGREPCRLFRPHAGWRSTTMYEALDLAGYRLAGWSWGMWDWRWWRQPRADHLADKLARKASPGDIVVIHDGHHANPDADRRHAAETIRLLVPRLRTRGYVFRALCGADPPASGGPGL